MDHVEPSRSARPNFNFDKDSDKTSNPPEKVVLVAPQGGIIGLKRSRLIILEGSNSSTRKKTSRIDEHARGGQPETTRIKKRKQEVKDPSWR